MLLHVDYHMGKQELGEWKEGEHPAERKHVGRVERSWKWESYMEPNTEGAWVPGLVVVNSCGAGSQQCHSQRPSP